MALQAERGAHKDLVGIIVFRIWQIIHYGQIMAGVGGGAGVAVIDNKVKESKCAVET